MDDPFVWGVIVGLLIAALAVLFDRAAEDQKK